jgi:hypothetical protein
MTSLPNEWARCINPKGRITFIPKRLMARAGGDDTHRTGLGPLRFERNTQRRIHTQRMRRTACDRFSPNRTKGTRIGWGTIQAHLFPCESSRMRRRVCLHATGKGWPRRGSPSCGLPIQEGAGPWSCCMPSPFCVALRARFGLVRSGLVHRTAFDFAFGAAGGMLPALIANSKQRSVRACPSVKPTPWHAALRKW